MRNHVLLSLILIQVTQANFAYAQQTSQAYTRPTVEYESDNITQMVELPEFPHYTGNAAFVAGTRFPNARAGASFTLKLRTTEYPQQVRDWYASALQEMGWKLETAMCNETVVAAWKGRRLCQVIVAQPSHKRFRCDLLIRFKDSD